jgi:thiol-disulfide isomerase/thioredoxin
MSIGLIAAVSLATLCSEVVVAADVPEDRVVVMYFHRTERCPTCEKMGSYAEEAVKRGFKEQLKKGTVAFHFIDFEDEKNEKLVKGYEVEDPKLIIAKITGNKVAKYTNLEDIWTKVSDKPAFLKYVQESVAAYRK